MLFFLLKGCSMIKKLITVSILLSLNACVFTATGSIGPIKQNTDSNQSSNTSSSNSNSEPSQLKDIAVKEVQAIPDQLVMVEGNKLKATANVVYVDNSRNSDIVWSSSDNTLASVNPTTGEISALKEGIVTIIATAQRDTSKRASITVTIKKADVVDALTKIEPKEATIKVGETIRFNASVQMSDGSVSPNVIWTSDNQSIATVSNGLVTGISEGTTNITATAQGDSTKKVSAKVTVTK
jgi:uncharacterized protein YjdB